MSFKNKVVVITGASAGIGEATAELFAKEGANLVIVGRNEQRLKDVSVKCEKLGARTLIVTAEMTDDDNVKSIIEKTLQKFEKLDILINNAGVAAYGSILNGKLMENFDKIMNTNLRAAVLLTTLAAPHLVKTKGNIVNISSVLGTSILGFPGHTAYCLSKAALNHFTRAAALELSSVGVRVNAVSPGPTRTDIMKKGGSQYTWEETQEFLKINRVSDPEEVADLIMFLASDKARSITGVDYVIDNGTLLKN